MAKTIARITGIALRPGVSKNNRLYTKEMIESAVTRAQERIRLGIAPMTMLTHHQAGDDAVQIVGRVDSWTVDVDGAVHYEASLPDTPHARVIAALVDPADGAPFLRGVSIRGGWVGTVRHKALPNGQRVEFGEDLELDGLDFTKSPGVLGAGVSSLTYSSTATENRDRTLIYETVQEARMVITEDAPDLEEKGAAALKSGKAAAAPTSGASNYADPGYQDDKAKRYPLDTAAHAKSAWSYINQSKNAKNYTAAQLKRIKDRIKRSLTKFGVKIDTKEGWLISPAVAVGETVTEDAWPDNPGSFSVSIYNGTVSINVSSYCIDPADLELCARAAMEGACQALNAMDPDVDGDIDTGENDATEETIKDTSVSENDNPESDQDSGPHDEESSVADQPTTPAADAPQTPPPLAPTAVDTGQNATTAATAPVGGLNVTLTEDQFAALMRKIGATQIAPAPAGGQLVTAGAAAESTPAAPAPVAEAAQSTPAAAPAAVQVAPAPVTETTDQMVARLVAEGVKAALPLAIQEAAQTGALPARKGLVPQVAETAAGTADTEYPASWPTDETGQPMPAHKMSNEQWKAASRPTLEQSVLKDRSVYRGDS